MGPLTIGSASIGTSVDFIVFAIFLGTGTFGTYEYIRLHRVRKIDARFPDFVRDLAEARRAGLTFTKAIMYASKGNYGVLTSEIKKISQQISWGSSVDDALNAFAKRVNTKLIRRTISLIVEASRSGGNVADVLDAASNDAREIRLLEAERRANMMAYVAVIYVGMGVFLMIIVILCGSLIPAMTGGESLSLSTATGGTGFITKEEIIPVFFYANLSQSIGMGLVAGVFEEGKVISGVKHIFIMVLITWLVFKLAIGV
jgi:flagellar protein FlaJ